MHLPFRLGSLPGEFMDEGDEESARVLEMRIDSKTDQIDCSPDQLHSYWGR